MSPKKDLSKVKPIRIVPSLVGLAILISWNNVFPFTFS